ncbi:MAG: hypothetical protein N2554_03630 [Fimbriimonadales bacterium]|nr:hypothetical protein [Fimbriimonadales bacterium]
MQARYIYLRVQEMTRANPDLHDLPNLFRGWWMPYTYFHTMSIGARRIADRTKDSRSLHWLLSDVSRHASIVDVEYFLSLYERPYPEPALRDMWRKSLVQQFRREWGNGGDQLSRDIVEADRNRLAADYDALREFVDRRIAHLDPRWSGTIPSDQALEQFLTTAEDILNRYHGLIVGGSYLTMRPQIIYPWQAEFSVRWWIPPVREFYVDTEERKRREAVAARFRVDEALLGQLEQLIQKHESGAVLTDEELANLESLKQFISWLDEAKARLLLMPKPLTDEKKEQDSEVN